MMRFALCADDYALTPAVSRGILELLAARRLTAVSVMVTMPGWPAEAADLRAFAGIVDVGLHLNLTLGRPLGTLPGLGVSGRFPRLGSLVRAALLRRLPLAEVAAEIAAQIDAFAAHFGRLPDYVDGHQHVHVLPGIRRALLKIVAERGLAGRLWLRDPGDRPSAILSRRMPGKALTVAALGAGFSGQASALGFALNQGFAGFSDFDPRGDYAATFAGSLRSPGPRHLVMCHPGYADAALAALDPATASREGELGFLLSPAFPELLETHSAGLIRLSERPTSR